jgi:drug/metabolite transporter (DMT)-like permease
VFPAIAIVVTLAAATAFALSSVAEQRSTKQVPKRGVLSPRLLLDLLSRPLWLAAIALNAVGSVLQVVALRFGALALVQPLLVCNLVLAVLFAVAFRHRQPDWIILGGVVACAAGIAGFLAVGRPSGGLQTVSFSAVLPLAVVLGAVLAGCLGVLRWGPRKLRALVLAFATGADFGVTAFLLKLVSHALSQGFAEPARLWPLYAVAISGPLGFLLSQNAFQAGVLISPVLAVITTTDPLVSIAIAHVWLKEQIASSPPALAAEAVSLGVMVAGIVALSRRAPHVAHRLTGDDSSGRRSA